ncbi:ABC transporter substrate-binding protein [Geodermatophilus sabuli]|uniref:ABC transporter substrate-binding protein n=1 Tax=Geodermatophilus sabuli TaxID=1564158 RepID=A0A7K3W433_9ACTN|nr:ABC transporter substrate-binding protein [Geodermatophilus sabuli]NEK59113.1 ABC transporter substrate-binding protein [Geodermatophilus sabuli]
MRSARTPLALLCLVGLTAAACGGGDEEPAAAAGGGDAGCEEPTEPQTVTLGVNPGAQDLVTFVMEEQGFAQDHNLELEVQSFQNPAALHAAIGQQTVDIGFGGITAMAVLRAQGRGTVVFDILTSPSNIVFTRVDSDIQSLEDLEGRKLGSFGGRGSATFAITSIVASEAYGIESLGDDVEIIEAPDAALFGLLDAGNIDAALVGTTATVQGLLADDKYRPLTDISEDYQSEFGALPGHVTVATYDEYAEANCGTLRSFSAALDETVEYIQGNEQVWQDYAQDIELTDPRAPELLQERVATRYIQEWNQEQADAEAELIEMLIPVLGEAEFVSEVPEGLFRTDIQEEA